MPQWPVGMGMSGMFVILREVRAGFYAFAGFMANMPVFGNVRD